MNEYGFFPGQILFKKRKKLGRAFLNLDFNFLEATSLKNIVDVKSEDILIFIDIIQDACVADLKMPMAKILSPYGVIYIQPSRLVSEENRNREDELGY